MTEAIPREITAFVRRRAWAEPHVRAWWVFAIVMFILAASLAVEQFGVWSRLHRAVATGTTVQAKVLHTVEFGQRKFSSNEPMYLEYDYNGQHFQVVGTLEGLDRYVQENEIVPLHIDPADPGNWTVRDHVITLSAALVGPILVLPVAIVALLIAAMARRKVLQTYRDGREATATVSANRLTPIAPLSRAIGCSIVEGGRVIEIIVPKTAGPLAIGDPVEVILPAQGGRPLAAAWFEPIQG